jgi:hypothetical protein
MFVGGRYRGGKAALRMRRANAQGPADRGSGSGPATIVASAMTRVVAMTGLHSLVPLSAPTVV